MADVAAFFGAQAEAGSQVQFIYDVTQGRVVFVNAAYKQVLGGTQDGVNADLPALLARVHPDDWKYLRHCWQLWAQGRALEEVEIRLRRPSDSDQWFCLTPFQQQAPEGTVLVGGMLRDITVSKHYQENADRFNTRKNATLEILSHDLSGAFVLVQQITDYLQEEVTFPADSRVAEMLRVLATTSKQSVRMIRDFVNLEFLASTNTDLKRSRVEVGAVLREPLEELQRSRGLLGQSFAYTLPDQPVYALLDVNKFTQVLTNLVSNALKFTPDEGRVQVLITSPPDRVQIQVIDEGVGIPLNLQPYLFEAFTKARRPGLRGEPTTGLGLALCKTIVEWHQGTLSVESTEGQGSSFTIDLPQAVTVARQSARKAAQQGDDTVVPNA